MTTPLLTSPSTADLLEQLLATSRELSVLPGTSSGAGDSYESVGLRLGRIGHALGLAYGAAGTSVPAHSVRPDREVGLTMFLVREELPGRRWLALFDATWPAYRRWFLSEGSGARPSVAECRSALRRYMPELLPIWEHLTALVDDDEAARMLSMWRPPPFAPGCSQLVGQGPPRHLVRNYDYDPNLFEQVVFSSRFGERRVIGTSDCLWGLLDGMNDQGLVVSLTFGGRRSNGNGFAIPLVLRYLLEVCTTVDEATAVLRRVPVSAAYNVTIADRRSSVTAFVSPDAAPEFFAAPLATNHRGTHPEDLAIARTLNSVERYDRLVALSDADTSVEEAAACFLEPPLHNTAYSQGFGTLYTAIYRPDEGIVEYRWPDAQWRLHFDSGDQSCNVVLREPASP